MTRTRRVLITGGQGRLAKTVAPAFDDAGWDVVALGHDELDVTSASDVSRRVSAERPDLVLNLAAITDLRRCEADPDLAHRVHVLGVRHLRVACDSVGAHLCHISSDYVFGNGHTSPIAEGETTDPLSVYGRTKLAGELELGPNATLVRTAWLVGRHGPNVVLNVLRQAADPQRPLVYVDDQCGSPTASSDLARMLLMLAGDRVSGMFHITNAGSASWYEIAVHALEVAGYDPDRVQPSPGSVVEPEVAPLRPHYSALANTELERRALPTLGPWQDAVTELVKGHADSLR